MKISTKEQQRPMTKTSSFLRLLVKICLIMIKKSGNDKINFSFTKLILYLIGSFGWITSGFILSISSDSESSFADYLLKVFKVLVIFH